MKTKKFISYLREFSCYIVSENGRHAKVRNEKTGAQYPVPIDHKIINDNTAKNICKQLGIPKPTSF